MGISYVEADHPYCRVHPNKDEQGSRLSILEHMGFQRMEVEHDSFSQDMPNIGDATNRYFCVTIVTSTSQVCEQTIRTSQQGKECLTTKLEPHVPICIPPFEFDRRNPEEGNETWNAVEEIFLSSLSFFEALLPRVGNLPWASYALWPLRLLGSRGSRLRDSWAIGAPGSSVTTLLTSIDHSIIQTICSSLYACDEYPVKILVPC